MFRSLLVLALIAASSGCMQTENSNALDKRSSGGSEAFQAAQKIFTTSCSASGCHPDFGSNDESYFKTTGRMIPGNPDSSPIYNYLQGSSGTGPKTMPKNASALTADEVATIRAWVAGAQ